MRKFGGAILLAVALTVAAGANAATTLDVGTGTDIDVGDSFDGLTNNLYTVINGILGTTYASDNAMAADTNLILVDVDDYDADGPMFDLERNFVFRVEIAGSDHRLSAVDASNNSQVLFNYGSSPTLTNAVGAGIASPFQLVLDVSAGYALSSDYTANDPTLNPGSSTINNQGVQMLLFDVSSFGKPFQYIFAFEDKYQALGAGSNDWDYNDFVGTITVVPVPAAAGLALLGMAGVGGMQIRRRKAVKS